MKVSFNFVVKTTHFPQSPGLRAQTENVTMTQVSGTAS